MRDHRNDHRKRRDYPAPTGTHLNAYEVALPTAFGVPVNTYEITRVLEAEPCHEDRGEMVGLVWDYWRDNRVYCSGRNPFVIDLDPEHVAIPMTWDLPECDDFQGYRILKDSSFVASPREPDHRLIILGVLRNAVKKRFADQQSPQLGPLWRCYGDFCQMPKDATDGDYCYCRRFGVKPLLLADGRIVLQIAVTTVCLDGHPLDQYYREGNVSQLAQMLEAKRANRADRRGRPIGIGVWCDYSDGASVHAEHLELDDPEGIIAQGQLAHDDQRSLASACVQCHAYNKPPDWIELSRLRLVLHTDITGEQHSRTIIAPDERHQLEACVRDLLTDAPLLDTTMRLAAVPISTDQFRTIELRPPAVFVRDQWGQARRLDAPTAFTFPRLRQRAMERSLAVERCGFLHELPISPVLAWPKRLRSDGGRRMCADLNHILKQRGTQYRFHHLIYSDSADLRSQTDNSQYDAVLAVLPERSDHPYGSDDTHDQIKRCLEIPSKCIHYDNTLPPEWVRTLPKHLTHERDRIRYKRIMQRYRLTMDHLLVKCGWTPFRPAEPFNFNVHVGIDVGGRRNDQVVACVGHGFCQPDLPLAVMTHQINVEIGQQEPIPTRSLFQGLADMFNRLEAEAKRGGINIGLDTVLFFRDGAMLGHGDDWNEFQAIVDLHQQLLTQRRISERSRWAVAEIHKRAELWRVYDHTANAIMNPLVGRCIYDFERTNEGVLCTTGLPYLHHGSANPVKLAVTPVAGSIEFSEIARDASWEADMGFTKPDMGRGLPWILHLADIGALHASRGYNIIGARA